MHEKVEGGGDWVLAETTLIKLVFGSPKIVTPTPDACPNAVKKSVIGLWTEIAPKKRKWRRK